MMQREMATHKQRLSRQAHSVFALRRNVQYIHLTEHKSGSNSRIVDAIF